MKNKYSLAGIILCFFLINGIAISQEINSIKICTPEWEYYTQKDGKGLYNELWKEVFLSANIELNIRYVPFIRCEKTVKRMKNQYDVYAAGYPSDDVIVPKWHIGIDLITVVYNKGFISKWEGQKSLENKIVSWERGFDFDKNGIVKVAVKKHEFSKLESALKMLIVKRIDFVLDYNLAIKKKITELNISDKVEIVIDAIKGYKYYMIFSQTEKGEKLSKIWDEAMKKLDKSGKLHQMYRNYEDPAY